MVMTRLPGFDNVDMFGLGE